MAKHPNKTNKCNTMAPFKISDNDGDATTMLLRPWMQSLIDKSAVASSSSRLRLPIRNIINERMTRDNYKQGIFNNVKIWGLNRVFKYNVYGVVRDSVNLQLSCI